MTLLGSNWFAEDGRKLPSSWFFLKLCTSVKFSLRIFMRNISLDRDQWLTHHKKKRLKLPLKEVVQQLSHG